MYRLVCKAQDIAGNLYSPHIKKESENETVESSSLFFFFSYQLKNSF